MEELRRMVEAWLRRVRSRRDLYAVAIVVIAPLGYGALVLGRDGLIFAGAVLAGIILVLLLATFGDDG